MLRLLVLSTLLTMNSACASHRPIDADNNVVRMPSHTFTIPLDRGWMGQELPGPQQTQLQFEDGLNLYRVGVFLRPVEDPEMQALPADELAALYFRLEEKRMRKADGGRYELRDLVTGTEELGGRLFHTCSYTAAADDFAAQTFLFLRIPFEQGNAAAVAVELRQASLHGPPLEADPARLADARAIAASLVLEEASFVP